MRKGNGARLFFTAVLAVAVVAGLAVGSAYADAQWQVTINVAEVGGANRDLVFGVHPQATDGTDNGLGGTTDLGEVEQPPLPPAGSFDARFASQLILDLRSGASPIEQKTLGINFQRAAGGDIVLTWDNNKLAGKVTSAVLQDPFTGTMVNVDMKTTGTVTVTNASIASLNLIFTSVDPYVVAYTQLVITQTPTTANSGQAMTPPLLVKIQDAEGTGAADVAVTVTLASGAGTLSGTFTKTTDGTGVATFDDLVYQPSADGGEVFTIKADANDHYGNPITATTGNIVVLAPPVLTPVGAAVAPNKENQRPLLSWAAAVGAVSYRLDLGTVASGCESVANDVAVAGTTYQSPRLTDGNYCWRVQSIAAAGNASPWSANDNFDVIPTFGEWGLIFLIASMVGVGGLFFYRRRAGSRA